MATRNLSPPLRYPKFYELHLWLHEWCLEKRYMYLFQCPRELLGGAILCLYPSLTFVYRDSNHIVIHRFALPSPTFLNSARAAQDYLLLCFYQRKELHVTSYVDGLTYTGQVKGSTFCYTTSVANQGEWPMEPSSECLPCGFYSPGSWWEDGNR
jgi:hypothetical protein